MIDTCMHCGDTIEYVFYMSKWLSATAMENTAVCPKHAKGHEPL